MNKVNRILILATAALALTACTVNTSPGEGDKVGQIAKYQEKGLLPACKVPVILVTGKFGGGELLAAIRRENKELIAKAKHFNDTQEQVKVFYEAEFVEGFCDIGDGAGTTFVTDIISWPEGSVSAVEVK